MKRRKHESVAFVTHLLMDDHDSPMADADNSGYPIINVMSGGSVILSMVVKTLFFSTITFGS